ncbi:ABC transporter ATP-binding protein [Actinoplanes sp. NPDC051851]|uniref:ABC transporter ATP-binding protein n=1 Tax=Actinoplanes sp. NPDC051851 TaxID=3154753 RepID=UPI003443AC67
MAELEGLRAEGVTLGYGDRPVVRQLSVRIPSGRITVIVGPNACGKSTLLRGLARLLRPGGGDVVLDGRDINTLSSRTVARRLGILPQTPVAPDGMRVADLVGRGRYPHHGMFDRWGDADDEAVAAALLATGTAELADRIVDELSGGQRQRVWIAMALAQHTGILLLDEPTTYLDVTHQIEVLDLLTDLNRRDAVTLVLVLHDLHLAGRYADHLVVMKDGRLVTEGAPADVITEATVADVFGLASRVIPDPVSGTPLVLPIGRHHGGPQPVASMAAPEGAEKG